jgi:hypothetical protein
MTAWLLHVAQLRDSPLWSAYCDSLPLVEDMSPLLCYSPSEAAELQLPWLVKEAQVQHDYLLYQHDRWAWEGAGLGRAGLGLGQAGRHCGGLLPCQ